MLPVAKHLSFSEIPLVDLGPMRDGSPSARLAVARELAEACQKVGFLYIQNHGVDEEKIRRIFAAGAEFFALPEAAKAEVSIAKNSLFRGWLPSFTKGADRNIKENLQEAFQIYRELPADDADILSGKPLFGLNPWPSALPQLRPVMLEYFDEMTRLSHQLLRLFALGLGLPEEKFLPYFSKSLDWLRVLHYVRQDMTIADKHIGTRPHTDGSAFTILAQDAHGGLEAYNLDDEWVAVPPIPGTFVVNIGEIMKVWSDGVFTATLHRVINRTSDHRYSVPFFVVPDYDVIIEPLISHPDPSFVPPVYLSSLSMHETVQCGQFVLAQNERIYPTKPRSEPALP